MTYELLLLPIAFTLAFIVSILIFWIGGKYSVKGRITKNKVSPYSCGEDLPYEGNARINLERFFIFAVYFLVFDVVAFMLAISYNTAVVYAIIYALITLASTLFVIKKR